MCQRRPAPSDAQVARKRAKRKAAKARRNVRPYVVGKLLLRLADRDGWVCHLCGLPVPRGQWLAGDPLRPTLDHLHPKSLGGGKRSTGNLKLAHFECNNRRGNAPLEEAREAARATRGAR